MEIGRDLGFKPVKEWSKATMLRHLWALSCKSDSQRVKWIMRNLWHMTLPQDSSWTLWRLFKLRVMCQPLIRYIVGDGTKTPRFFLEFKEIV